MEITRLFFLIMLLCSLSISCEKNDTPKPDTTELEGIWVLFEVTGGIHGEGYTPPFNLIRFEGDQYSLWINDEQVSAGTFVYDEDAEHGLAFQPTTQSPAVGFEQQPKSVQLEENDNRLVLADPCCDLYTYRFVREGTDPE